MHCCRPLWRTRANGQLTSSYASRVPFKPPGHAPYRRQISTTHAEQHAAAKEASSKRRPYLKVLLTGIGAGGAALSYLVYTDHHAHSNPAGVATQNVRFQRRIPEAAASAVDSIGSTSRDPLSLLDPNELASSSAHLVDLPLSQLLRAYIVFLASSSPLLVDIAPPTIEKLEWLRDNLPLGLGRPLWGLLVFVSQSPPLTAANRTNVLSGTVGHETDLFRAVCRGGDGTRIISSTGEIALERLLGHA